VRVDHELDDGDVLDFGGGAQAVAVPGAATKLRAASDRLSG
jgi:hypothetical protein